MGDIAAQLCDALPAEPISVADVFAVKKQAYPDVDPILGLNPEPKKNVIVLHVTEGDTASYLGVEESGWEILTTFTVEDLATMQAAVMENLELVMEWAETYYSSETFAMLQRGG